MESDDLLHDDPPATPAGHRDDDDAVRDCLVSTAGYLHDQLPEDVRDHLHEKWGIESDTVDRLGIGYVPSDDGLVEYLRGSFEDATIARTGLVSVDVLKHAYECRPGECGHDVPTVVADLARRRADEEVDPTSIDPTAVIEAAAEVEMRVWWDERIVFPYWNADREISYFIARATDGTDDITYGDGSRPKYVKQSVNKPWVNTDAVQEPLYGEFSVREDKPLILTEGVTDAIMAHQAGFAAVSPAARSFKTEHHEDLVEIAEDASEVFLVNDNEESGVGLKGALRTADVLKSAGIDVRVAILPREGAEKMDVAEYLRTHDVLDFEMRLAEAIDPEDHPKYDEISHPNRGPGGGDRERSVSIPGNAGGSASGEIDADGASALFDLTMDDVVRLDVNLTGGRTGYLYRGDNPIRHHGQDHSNYFVIVENGGDLRAYDYKTDYEYTPLTWLACKVAGRPTGNPGGPLSPAETWEVWRYAKEEDRLPVPEDDPVPRRAMLHVAAEHDLAPIEELADQVGWDAWLPPTVYDRVVETIREEYDVDPGREPMG